MFGVDYQSAENYFEELKSQRTVATQLKKQATDENEEAIISRTFSVYSFDDVASIKTINSPPPFWVGVIPSDPSTYTNPITEPITYHYLVRSKFTIDEYTGYLMYAQPIENIEEYIEELERRGELDKFVDPSNVNLYKGWFKREINMYAYDYYLPIRTNTSFVWEIEYKLETLKVPNYKASLDKVGGVESYPSDNFDELIEEKVDSYESQGYDVKLVDLSDDSYLKTNIIAKKNIYNLGGVSLVSYDLTTFKTVFEIKRDSDTGVAIKFTIRNCKVWLSNDGVTLSKPISVSHYGVFLNTSFVVIESLKLYKYIIIEPNLEYEENKLGSQLKYPPLKFTPNVNQGFNFKAEFLGRHYLHFKEEVIDISTEQELVVNPDSYVVDFSDPKPYEIDLHPYNFSDPITGIGSHDSYWDGAISL
jgi:hypothetical protein